MLRQGIALYLWLSVGSAALARYPLNHAPLKRDECSSLRQVMPWGNLTTDEKQSYLDAAVCLTTSPAKLGLGNSITRWDELQYNHIFQVGWIHFVGQFLPWHRYWVAIHANILRDECDYSGPIPYWDEIADAELADLADSDLFQADAFGGNGVGDTECIQDGPFANVSLAAVASSSFGNNATDGNTCIFRSLSISTLQNSNQTAIDTCLAKTTFLDAWDCIENGPHAGGHGGVGGLMTSTANSPGDPVFYLHHAFIDLLWWRWQSQDLDTRLTEIGGNNSPTSGFCSFSGGSCPDASILDYDGDDGNTTTLDHVLWMMDIYPNITVADVMNINSSDVCFEYLW